MIKSTYNFNWLKEDLLEYKETAAVFRVQAVVISFNFTLENEKTKISPGDNFVILVYFIFLFIQSAFNFIIFNLNSAFLFLNSWGLSSSELISDMLCVRYSGIWRGWDERSLKLFFQVSCNTQKFMDIWEVSDRAGNYLMS